MHEGLWVGSMGWVYDLMDNREVVGKSRKAWLYAWNDLDSPTWVSCFRLAPYRLAPFL